MGLTRPNPTHMGWVGLNLCDGLGWIFFDPPWWISSKNPFNLTQPDPCTPLEQILKPRKRDAESITITLPTTCWNSKSQSQKENHTHSRFLNPRLFLRKQKKRKCDIKLKTTWHLFLSLTTTFYFENFPVHSTSQQSNQ